MDISVIGIIAIVVIVLIGAGLYLSGLVSLEVENDEEFEEEVSIGDYVISGGELAAMVLIDSVSRRLPNVLEIGRASCRERV